MENENKPLEGATTSSEPRIEVIKPETVVKVSMSSGFYKRIQDIMADFLAGKTSEEINSAHEQISSNNITDEWVQHYETLLILAKEFEELARKEGFIVSVTADEAAELFKSEDL